MEGEEDPLALGGGPGQDPHAAAKVAAKLAEAERRQAEHDCEVQKVDEPQTSQTPAQAAAQTLQAAEAMHEASEAARALRASYLQACAEACAEGSHRPSRAPSAGSRARSSAGSSARSSARSSLSLVGGGNYSTRFSGVLPDHMPPEPTPHCGAAAARRYSAHP